MTDTDTDTDRIAQMAREAGADEAVKGLFYLGDDNLARFARLVAEDLAGVVLAVLVDCETRDVDDPPLEDVAQAIRARYSKTLATPPGDA